MQIIGDLVILLKYMLCLCVIFLRNRYLCSFFLCHSLPSFLTTRSLSLFPACIVLLSHALHNLAVTSRHLAIRPVILSAAKDLCGRLARSFAALRMTARVPLEAAHGKSSLQMSTISYSMAGAHVEFYEILCKASS